MGELESGTSQKSCSTTIFAFSIRDSATTPILGFLTAKIRKPTRTTTPKTPTTTMGDFLRKKLEFLFRYRYDVNSDGLINFEDYESVVKKLTSAAAVQPGDKFYDDTDARQQETFAILMESADKDGDGSISMDEFIEWGMNIAKRMEGEQLPDDLMKFFKLNWRNTDQNDDGMVDRDEYVAVHKLWDVPAKLSGPAFDSLTNNGEHQLDFKLYLDISKRFFSSYDVKDNSRYFYGCY